MEALTDQTKRYDLLKKRIKDASNIGHNDPLNQIRTTRNLFNQLESEYRCVFLHWSNQEVPPYASVVNKSTSSHLQDLNKTLLKLAAAHILAMEADISMNGQKIAKLLVGDKS